MKAALKRSRVKFPSKNFSSAEQASRYVKSALSTIAKGGQITFVITREDSKTFTLTSRLDLSLTKRAEERREAQQRAYDQLFKMMGFGLPEESKPRKDPDPFDDNF